MYESVCSHKSQNTVRPKKSAWYNSVSDYIWIAALAISSAMNPNYAKAQTSYGSVVGTVKDSAGALIAGAQVQLTNTGTNAEQKAVTSSAGTYTFINLNPGSYNVTVSHADSKLQRPTRWTSRSAE